MQQPCEFACCGRIVVVRRREALHSSTRRGAESCNVEMGQGCSAPRGGRRAAHVGVREWRNPTLHGAGPSAAGGVYGVDPKVLRSLRSRSSAHEIYAGSGLADDVCCICLSGLGCAEPEFGPAAWPLREHRPRNPSTLLLPCGHKFHWSCAERWLRTHDSCPQCRSPVVPAAGPKAAEPDPSPEFLQPHQWRPVRPRRWPTEEPSTVP